MRLSDNVCAPWYISNKVLHADLKVLTIREEVTKFNIKHRDKITNFMYVCPCIIYENDERYQLDAHHPPTQSSLLQCRTPYAVVQYVYNLILLKMGN